METLLVFLAIIAIQLVAAYSKQKKEAERKKQKAPEHIPQEAAPIPDPFREIREAMGLPPVEEPEEPEELEEPEEFVMRKIPEPEYKNEGFAPKNMPFKSITDRKLKNDNEPVHIEAQNLAPMPAQARRLKIHNAIDINNLEQGILWTAILQQPRHRAKWKPK
jgi:hypothetical protein